MNLFHPKALKQSVFVALEQMEQIKLQFPI